MNKSRFFFLLICGLILSNLLLIWFLFNKKSNHVKLTGPKQLIIQKLDFTPKQVKEYEVLITKHQEDIVSQDTLLKKAKTHLYQRLNTEISNVERDSLIAYITQIQTTIERIHFIHFSQIKELCAPEQLDKFEKLTKELQQLFRRPPPKKQK